MLCHPNHHFHHPYITHRTTTFTTYCTLSPHTQPTEETPQPNYHRTHNSKSYHLLQTQLDHQKQKQNPPTNQKTQTFLPKQQKDQNFTLTHVRKRHPLFPGSISHTQNDPFVPPRNTLLVNDEEDESEVIMRAIEIRRKVTYEIFVDSMISKGKFGITYSKNVANLIGGFLDSVMIEAANMKVLPECYGLSFNARARRVVLDSEVVFLIRWLKHNELSYPQIARMICLSKGNVQSVRRRVEWLKSIHVKGRYLGIVFMRVGETILMRSMEELDEVTLYLEGKGVRSIWMGYVISRCPELLAFSMDELKRRVSFYTDMGMNEHDFGTMVYDCPKVLGFFTFEDMKQKVNYLKDFGLGDDGVGRLLAFKPQLMLLGIEDKWKPILKYLYYLGIDREGMKRILHVKPVIFCVDLEITIVPKVQFLQEIGIKEDAIGRMLVRFPSLLTSSLHKKIRPVVVFLLTNAGVTQKNIAKVIALAPELLGCNIAHKLDVNVKYFLSLGITRQQLGEMIADFPLLLRYNADILRPKYQYLRRTMICPLKDVIEFPRFFSYSLEEKIIPRYKIMVENRVNFKLRYMLPGSDEEFNKRVQEAVERRRRFELGLYKPDDKIVATEQQPGTSSYDLGSDSVTVVSSVSESLQSKYTNALLLEQQKE